MRTCSAAEKTCCGNATWMATDHGVPTFIARSGRSGRAHGRHRESTNKLNINWIFDPHDFVSAAGLGRPRPAALPVTRAMTPYEVCFAEYHTEGHGDGPEPRRSVRSRPDGAIQSRNRANRRGAGLGGGASSRPARPCGAETPVRAEPEAHAATADCVHVSFPQCGGAG